jgi:transcription antitermination factor NusG
MVSWYALRVRSNFEAATASFLQSTGYEIFSPTYRIRRRGYDRQRVVDLPLFRGYVFSRFDINKRLPILQAPGVVGIVNFGGKFTAVPPDELEIVRRVAVDVPNPEPWTYMAAGQRVRIEEGPLVGVEGVLAQVGRNHWVVVSIEMLQRSVAARVSVDSIKLIDHPTVKSASPAVRVLESVAGR